MDEKMLTSTQYILIYGEKGILIYVKNTNINENALKLVKSIKESMKSVHWLPQDHEWITLNKNSIIAGNGLGDLKYQGFCDNWETLRV